MLHFRIVIGRLEQITRERGVMVVDGNDLYQLSYMESFVFFCVFWHMLE